MMLLDYLKQYGHVAFSKEPLNYLDLLAFTGMSYLDYPAECVGGTLHNALKLAHEPIVNVGSGSKRDDIVAMRMKNAEQLVSAAMDASRYRLVHLRAFKSAYHEGLQQFAAMTLSIGDLLVVVYRGTDETVTGWEEALKLSLHEPVGAQVDSVHFLEESSKLCDGPIVICGHSKGGNLAEFSSAVVAGENDEVNDRIAAIVSFDGPGLSPTVRDSKGYKRIAGRIRTFIPGSGIIGNIFKHPDGAVVYVESKKQFLEQHVFFNWETDGTHFITRKRQSLAGLTGSFALGSLIDNLDDNQKKGIFKAIFAIPKALGRKRL